MNIAFEITVEDVETVLETHFKSEIKGFNIHEVAKSIFEYIDTDAVEQAALNSGVDMDDQIDGALEEIRSQIVEEDLVSDALMDIEIEQLKDEKRGLYPDKDDVSN